MLYEAVASHIYEEGAPCKGQTCLKQDTEARMGQQGMMGGERGHLLRREAPSAKLGRCSQPMASQDGMIERSGIGRHD